MTHHPVYLSVFAPFFRTVLLLTAFLVSDAAAQGKASVSASAGRPNAVFLELPRNPDPCGAFLANMPQRYRNLTLQFGPVDLDTKTLFLLKCNEKKDELIETITRPIEELKKSAQGAVQSEIDRVRNDLTGGFWKFASEMMLEQLPESERQKYAPGSDEALALAHEWLNDPSAEFGLYVDAYFSQPGSGSRLYDAYKAYIDLTNGESKAILDGLNGVLDRARARLSQVLNANSAVEAAPPDTPTAEILENAGLSGQWVDNFKNYEGQIRDFDKTWKVQEALTIMQGAFATDVPHEKVRAFFNLMNTMSSLASDSNIPLVSLVGDIIGNYALIANQTLDAVLALGEKIKQRHGFCLGLGVATDDPRTTYFSDQDILACPMAIGTWPFRHIYEAQEKESGRLFFWDGSTFIRGEDGGGRSGVLAALRLIEDAGDLGYQVQKDPPEHVKLLGEVYNTAHPGGVPGLLEEAQRIVGSLDAVARRFVRVTTLADSCSEEQILQTAGDQADFSISNFQKELKENGTSRLTATIAASFLALEGRIGAGSRTDAFQTYFGAEERASGLSFLVLEGLVFDQDRNPIADAELEVRIDAGEEPRGCETWLAGADGRFVVYAIGTMPGLAIDVRATADGADGKSEKFDITHFRATSRQVIAEGDALFARAPGEIILQIGSDDEQSGKDSEPQPEGGDGNNEGEETRQEEEAARAAAVCDAAGQRLDEALALAGEGKISSARDLLAELKSSQCSAVAAQAAELDAEIAQVVIDAVEQARVAAGQCDVAALQRAAESLEALDDPSAKSMQADISSRIPAVSAAINRFEEARAAYKAGNLVSARSGLVGARDMFEGLAGKTDCSGYLSRIETGLGKITTLETALAKADQAIIGCHAGTISAYERRFAGLAAEHVLIAGKAAELTRALGNLSSATALIDSALNAQERGETDRAATFIANARTILDGPLAGSNCDTLRAKMDIAEAQQPRPEAAGTGDETVTENRCAPMQAMRDQATSAYFDGRLEAARDTLTLMQGSMPDESLLKGCEDIVGDAANWARYIDHVINLLARAQDAINTCRQSEFDALESDLAGYPITPARQALARLGVARTTCGSGTANSDDSGETVILPDEPLTIPGDEEEPLAETPPTPENEVQTAEEDTSELQTETDPDGDWTGTGEFSVTAAGQRFVLEMRIDLSLSSGRSSGDVTFFQDGNSVARFPISGTFNRSGVVHENRWTYEGLRIPNAFKGRFSSENSIDGDGYLGLPEMNCFAKAIGEIAGGAAAGALGMFSDDDESGGNAPCPIKRYPLRWSAQKR
jgi:hypothetical protein